MYRRCRNRSEKSLLDRSNSSLRVLQYVFDKLSRHVIGDISAGDLPRLAVDDHDGVDEALSTRNVGNISDELGLMDDPP